MDLNGHVKLQTACLVVIALIALGFLLQITSAFTIPFVIAVLLVIAIAPAERWLRARGVPGGLATGLVLFGLFLVMFGLGLLVYDSVRAVTQGIDPYVERGRALLQRLDGLAQDNLGMSVLDGFSSGGGSLGEMLSSRHAIQTINSSLGSFMGFLSGLLMTLLFLMFILGSRELFKRKVEKILEEREFDAEGREELITKMTGQVQEYLLLKTAISLCTGAAVWLVAFAFGLDFAIVWGFLAFILNYIPSIGPIIASAPPIAIAFLQFENLWIAALVSALMLVIQFLSGNVVEPKIMGDRLNLNIVVVLMSLFVWGLVWGFVGMVLSVPLTACVNIALANTRRYKSVSVWLSG